MLSAVGALVLALGAVSPAHAAEERGRAFDTIKNGVAISASLPAQWLSAGQSWRFGHSRMDMQRDGNLVIYNNTNGRVLWASNTQNSGAVQLRFQKDGNLVLYTAANRHVWSTGTFQDDCDMQGADGVLLGLQSDGNFVIYCAELRLATNPSGNALKAMWSPNTH